MYVEGCIIKRWLRERIWFCWGGEGVIYVMCNIYACLDSIVEQQTTSRGKTKPNSNKSIETNEIKIKWIKLIELHWKGTQWILLIVCSSLPLNPCDCFFFCFGFAACLWIGMPIKAFKRFIWWIFMAMQLMRAFLLCECECDSGWKSTYALTKVPITYHFWPLLAYDLIVKLD